MMICGEVLSDATISHESSRPITSLVQVPPFSASSSYNFVLRRLRKGSNLELICAKQSHIPSMLRHRPALPLRRLTRSLAPRSPRFSSTAGININASPYSPSPSTSGSSINPAEISHFSRFSSQWWDEQGEFALLHKMNPPRMQFIRDKILEIGREDEDKGEAWAEERHNGGTGFLSGMDVLDVGCGGGILSEVCEITVLCRLDGREDVRGNLC